MAIYVVLDGEGNEKMRTSDGGRAADARTALGAWARVVRDDGALLSVQMPAVELSRVRTRLHQILRSHGVPILTKRKAFALAAAARAAGLRPDGTPLQ